VPLKDEITAARDAALSDLAASHDFYAYSKAAWRAVQQAIQRDGLTFRWQNVVTQSTLDEQALATRAQRYVTVELASATLQQFVSVFEAFVSSVLQSWLRAHPQSLAKRQVTGREIYQAPDKAAIVGLLIERQLKEVLYDRPAKWFEHLKSLANIATPNAKEIVLFSEIKATRDVLVHSSGIANAYYVDKAGSGARATLGHALDVPEPYHFASWELIRKLVEDISAALIAKS
jgi:hypothetical protein